MKFLRVINMRGPSHWPVRPFDEFGEVVHGIGEEVPVKKLRS